MEFFKGKGYYVLLFVGVIAIAAVAIVGSRLSSDRKEEDNNNFVDLNDTDNNIAARDDSNDLADNNAESDDVTDNNLIENEVADSGTEEEDGQQVADNDSLLEFDVYTEEEEEGIDISETKDPVEEANAEEETQETETVETSGSTVKADNTPVQETLSFQADKGLLWPVNGNVIKNYSMDHTVYFETLMQYKCNPAIIIDAEVDTEVKAATTGIVTNIVNDTESGLTITTDIGNGFSLVYGQLKNVDLKVGDVVREGEVIGLISEPTKYYVIEGSNLYFQVLENNQTVDPMLYLR